MSLQKNLTGRLTAIIDTTTIPADGRRVDMPVVLGNVMATLKGTDPNDKRIFIISGHLDTRRTDVMDRTGDAPGANDDGSGTAAVIECARIMSQAFISGNNYFCCCKRRRTRFAGFHFYGQQSKKRKLGCCRSFQ